MLLTFTKPKFEGLIKENIKTMTDLQKEFEATGYTSWINSDLYPDGKIYTKEYTQWLERQVLSLRQPPVMPSLTPQIIGFIEWIQANDDWHFNQKEKRWIKDNWMPRTTFGLMEIYLKESDNE